METTILYGVKRKTSLKRCSQGAIKNKECKGPESERAWTLAEVAMGHLWLEWTVKREGGSRRGQVSVVGKRGSFRTLEPQLRTWAFTWSNLETH